MRTGRSLIVCRRLLPGEGYLLWGGSAPGGVCSREGVCLGGCLLRGVSAMGGVCLSACWDTTPRADTPPVNRMTNRCKNITLATTSLRSVKIIYNNFSSTRKNTGWETGKKNGPTTYSFYKILQFQCASEKDITSG